MKKTILITIPLKMFRILDESGNIGDFIGMFFNKVLYIRGILGAERVPRVQLMDGDIYSSDNISIVINDNLEREISIEKYDLSFVFEKIYTELLKVLNIDESEIPPLNDL